MLLLDIDLMTEKKLIELHSLTPYLTHCACCDGATKEVTLFYKVLEANNQLSFQTYLPCCKDKVGTVVDWYSWEDYNQVIEVKKIQGFNINQIKGYIPK